jgi:hypothetical protein
MIRVATMPQQRARHRRWRAPNDPTRPAKQIWAHLYPDQPWPMGWEVKWAGFIRGATGLTSLLAPRDPPQLRRRPSRHLARPSRLRCTSSSTSAAAPPCAMGRSSLGS